MLWESIISHSLPPRPHMCCQGDRTTSKYSKQTQPARSEIWGSVCLGKQYCSKHGSTQAPVVARSLPPKWAMDCPHHVPLYLGHRPLQDQGSSVLLERRNGGSRLGISRGAKVEASDSTSTLDCLRLDLPAQPTLSTNREDDLKATPPVRYYGCSLII